MPILGTRSTDNLKHVHPDLRKVVEAAIEKIDFTIICGQRGRSAQEDAFRKGASKARFGQSPHNFAPALAIDFIPHPFENADWERPEKFKAIGRAFVEAGKELGIPVEWGGDWSNFKDLPHVQLADWKTRKASCKLAP